MSRLVRALAMVWLIAASGNTLAAAPPAMSMMESGTCPSEALGRDEVFQIYLPPGYGDTDRTWPVIYFLHGMFDHQATWQERGLKPMVDKLIDDGAIQPMVIAIPNGGRFSFWTNGVSGDADVEDFLLQDFMPFIERTYRVRKDRDGRAVSGISMGGFGSLKIAFKLPDRFGSVSAHSPFLLPVPLDQLPPEELKTRRLRPFMATFGNPIDIDLWAANNPFQLLDPEKLKDLAIYFDCGEQDRFQFQRGAQRLSTALEASGITHVCRITAGGESHWDQLKANLRHSLQFHSKHFNQE